MPGRLTFDAALTEHRWTPAELELPSDWSAYAFLVLEVRADFSQWFELLLHVGDETRKLRLHPWQVA